MTGAFDHLPDPESSEWERWESVLSKFEEAWQSGRRPSIENFVADAEPPPIGLLLELIHVDRDRRIAAGDPAPIEEYLARFPKCRAGILARFDEPTATPLRPRPQPAQPPAPGPGSSIAVPGYEVLEEIGRGGMGVVYRARQTKANRVVALKVIRGSGLASVEERVRFQIEAEAVANLVHPNIVQLHEVGEWEGQPYFSMEYCGGGSLDGRLRGASLTGAAAVELVKTLARAMHHAHLHGVVHRDLKPANVLLTPEGTPKITDFGLAKRLGAGDDVSRTDTVLGTPAYMAPEQAEGRARDTGPAADVYALGVLLYECLTGRPPFRGRSAIETLHQVIREPPPPPSRFARVPRDLETICLKCLQKGPHQRYASAEALAEDLQRWQKGEPIQARPVSLAVRAAKWAWRKPALAALLTVILLALSGLLGVGLWYNARLARANDGLQGALETAKANLEAAEANKYFYLISLAHADYRVNNVASAEARLEECPPPLRGWEWRYLHRLCRGEVLTCRGSATEVFAVDVSPDGQYLAASGRDGADNFVTVWDANTGWLLREFQNRGGSVASLAFSADGQRLAAGSFDALVRIWNTATWIEQPAIPGHKQRINAVAFSPNGTWLASASDDGTVRVMDSTTGACERTLSPRRGRVTCLAFSADGQRLAGGCAGDPEGKADGHPAVMVWSVETWEPVATFREHRRGITRVAFSRDGRVASAAGGHDERMAQNGEIRIWDPDTARLLEGQARSQPPADSDGAGV